jgi:hypothetical protein
MDNGKILDDLLVECASALFSAYNRPLTYTGPTSSESQSFVLSGVIGFAGADMRGTLLLAMTHGLLEDLSPDAASRRDWIAELANQLLGRFKNQLLRFDAEIYAATPSVLRGELLTPLPPACALAGHRFESDRGSACVWLDMELRKGFVLKFPPGAEVAQAEGESLLFD